VMKQTPPSKRINGEDANVAAMKGTSDARVEFNDACCRRPRGIIIRARTDLFAGLSGLPACLRTGDSYRVRFHVAAECDASASGRAAQCEVNPFLAYAEPMKPFSHERRHHRRMHRME
jgi:Protein of unknown function (DUF3551)